MSDSMTAAYEICWNCYNGAASTGHNTNGGKVFTLNLLPLLDASSITTGVVSLRHQLL